MLDKIQHLLQIVMKISFVNQNVCTEPTPLIVHLRQIGVQAVFSQQRTNTSMSVRKFFFSFLFCLLCLLWKLDEFATFRRK